MKTFLILFVCTLIYPIKNQKSKDSIHKIKRVTNLKKELILKKYDQFIKVLLKNNVNIKKPIDTLTISSVKEHTFLAEREQNYIPCKSLSKKCNKKSKFIIPVSGRISSKFGRRKDPLTGVLLTFHKGIDISCPKGTEIKAAQDGIIYEAKYSNSYGKLMILKHKNNLYTYYAHQSRFKKKKGDHVNKGDVIGYVGSTGASTGPHLHFEIRKGGKPINPLNMKRD